MLNLLLSLALTSCITYADPASLGWWLTPESSEDLPHELEEDELGYWSELWLRPSGSVETQPTTVLEQMVGARWMGSSKGKETTPNHITVVLAGKKIVDFSGDKVKTGLIGDEFVTWSDGSKQALFEQKKRKRGRRHRAPVRMNFGKIALPPISAKVKKFPNWQVEGLSTMLEQIASTGDRKLDVRALSSVAQMTDPHGSVLGLRYSDSCSFEERQAIENTIAKNVDPKLTCWMSQNSLKGLQLLSALLQRPTIECKSTRPMTHQSCGMATMPMTDGFFPLSPKIWIVPSCEDLGGVIAHEIFHLAGLPEAEVDKAIEQSESCVSNPEGLTFENKREGFYNDLQVETRMFLFRKTRDDADKWGWTKGERAFFLGLLCSKMNDKNCARRYFQEAVESSSLVGSVELPEGGEVSLSTLAQFDLFDSISEDIYRMRELVRYLRRDPNGTLLIRLESGSYRVNEIFVARSALEQVKANKNICNAETDDRVLCEDLHQITKTSWFKNP